MKRADELFTFAMAASRSPLVAAVWETTSSDEAVMMSTAEPTWEVVVTREAGAVRVDLRGPEAEASPAPVPHDAEFLGIQFRLGTFVPGLSLRRLVGQGLTLPQLSGTRFALGGEAWEVPQAHNADVFVERLVRAGLLAHDPLVPAVLAGDGDVAAAYSPRTLERRTLRATGLPQGTIRRIRRAHEAVALLRAGVPAREAAGRAGYADQAHMTRSLRRFVGQTPSGIATAAAAGG
jgi:hypothetical protein